MCRRRAPFTLDTFQVLFDAVLMVYVRWAFAIRARQGVQFVRSWVDRIPAKVAISTNIMYSFNSNSISHFFCLNEQD